MIYKYDIVKDSTELRKAIAENPDLPIVVLVGQDAASDDFGYTYCCNVQCYVDDILDCQCEWQTDFETVYTDQSDFEDDLREYLSEQDEYEKLSDEEFDKIVEQEKLKYEPYWHKAIVVVADNP